VLITIRIRYLGRTKQLAKKIIIRQQAAILHINTPPYWRYKSEPVLESADVILYSGRTIRADTTVDFNRPDTAHIDGQNKTALVIDTAVPLTHNLAKTEAEKIMKYENLAVEIKNIWKPTTYLYTPQSSRRKNWSPKTSYSIYRI
jgi:hypothetical protein